MMQRVCINNRDSMQRVCNMSADELRLRLRDMQWTSAELARRVKVNPHTVSNWTTGKTPIPGSVAAFVRLACDMRMLLDG